jgi:mRNA-degrading endonuclease RelE of RelBE toxin-antitoxin system
MKHYTVTWSRRAEAELARLWLATEKRELLAQAADTLDRRLSHDPYHDSYLVTSLLRETTAMNLVILFTILEQDRRILVVGLRVIA